MVFGYPGGAILPVYDALRKFPIRHVLVRHEQGAAHMADGYARASGKVGVAVATSGPGATNLVTGIATAMLDSVPMVCITGQVSSKLLGTDAFQEVDITGITLPITKHNYIVTRAEDIARVMREAFMVARSGRPGPVLVDITKDAQQGSADFDFAAAEPKPHRPHPMLKTESAAILQAAELIRSAKRPMILAGHGIMESGAMDQVRTLAERMQIPVASTLLGLGAFPASHPLSLGMMGMHGEAWVNHAIQQVGLADRLRHALRRPGDRHADDLRAQREEDPHRDRSGGDQQERQGGCGADRRSAARCWKPLLPRIRRARKGDSAWVKAIEACKGDAAVRDIKNLPDLRASVRRARDQRSVARHRGKAIIVTDVGQHQMWEAQYYKHDAPRTLITSGGLGTMGFALPAAIGAKIACPDKEVWVIAGDGGFQMTAAELSTIAQEELDINIAIINNGFLGMVRQWQEFFYERNYPRRRFFARTL